jgi:hypothetical protein
MRRYGFKYSLFIWRCMSIEVGVLLVYMRRSHRLLCSMHSGWLVLCILRLSITISSATYIDPGTDVVGAYMTENLFTVTDASVVSVGGSSTMPDVYLFGGRLIRSGRWCNHCAWNPATNSYTFCNWCYSRGWWYVY